MWYTKLLEYLAWKICLDKEQAVFFLNNWIKLLENEFYDGKELEPLAIFGLIIDLYHHSVTNPEQKIQLAEFAQKCIGLSILHVKNACDDSNIWCVDFVDMIKDKNILKILNIHALINELQNDYLTGKRQRPEFQKISFFSNINSFVAYQIILNNIVYTDVLMHFEREAFREINYHVKVEIKEIILLMNEFLDSCRPSEQKELLRNFCSYLLPYEKRSPEFDHFIATVEGIKENRSRMNMGCFKGGVFGSSSTNALSKSDNIDLLWETKVRELS